jgi:hypothetical protein
VTLLHAEKKIVIDGSTTVGPIAKAFAEDVICLMKGDIRSICVGLVCSDYSA